MLSLPRKKTHKGKNMKFTKLSLAAALAVSAAFAGGDIAPVEPAAAAPAVPSVSKITGQASLWYSTSDRRANIDLFDKAGGTGDAALRLDYTRSMYDGMVTFNAGVQMLSTLGLENTLVGATFVSHGGHTGGLDDAMWIDVFNATISLGNTAIIAGRQAIDTPFFYTETWNIAKNTFDAVVVANNDLPDTTLVGAWVGRGNGCPSTVCADDTNIGGGMNGFFGNHPAYAVGAVTKLIPNTVAQAWYYNIPSVADAYWVQADANIAGIEVGAQYAGTSLTGGPDSDAWAVRLGYSANDFGVWGAYSQRSDDAGLDISNIATMSLFPASTSAVKGSQSKLYTEAYWAYGYVGEQDAQSFAIGGHYDFGFATVNAQYTDVATDMDSANVRDMNEFYLGTTVDLGPVKTTVAYTSTEVGQSNGDGSDRFNTLIFMLDMPFEL